MRSTLYREHGFAYLADLRPLAAPLGVFSLTVCSSWNQAKQPDAERRVLQLNLDAHGLAALRNLIDSVLSTASTSVSDDANGG